MRIGAELLVGIVSVALMLTILWDAFVTIVLSRHVTMRYRLSRVFYWGTWLLWSSAVRRTSDRRRQTYLSFYGPLSLILLLIVWAGALMSGFALLQWSLGSPLASARGSPGLARDLYMSGTTFVTLGLGDVVPTSRPAKAVVVIEASTGFGFLALLIGYLPVLYQAFAQREMDISLMDARAGTPPSAGELLRRFAGVDNVPALEQLLHQWERWTAGLLESHLSHTPLAYFRSQHRDQSWVASLAVILDASALVITGINGVPDHQARLTFTTARKAATELAAFYLGAGPAPRPDRLPPADLAELHRTLAEAGMPPRADDVAGRRLTELRATYEPAMNTLSDHLLMALPPWLPAAGAREAWELARSSEPAAPRAG